MNFRNKKDLLNKSNLNAIQTLNQMNQNNINRNNNVYIMNNFINNNVNNYSRMNPIIPKGNLYQKQIINNKIINNRYSGTPNL